MNILDMINGNGGATAQQLATQFGLTPQQANGALAALVPLVTAGLKREVAAKGEEGLATALETGGHESYLSRPEVLADPATATEGSAILGHIFGSKDVSSKVADGAAKKTGLDPQIIQMMLPVVTAIVMGALARSKNAAPPAGGATPSGAGLGGILGSILDRNHDGSVMDDLTGMIGGALGGRG